MVHAVFYASQCSDATMKKLSQEFKGLKIYKCITRCDKFKVDAAVWLITISNSRSSAFSYRPIAIDSVVSGYTSVYSLPSITLSRSRGNHR